ncbi:MAG TPA: hypothetical protein VN256_04275 [Pyrinomonadaceae bacterium]|nr:hypothetical protein [Pyrinomonadaceae bacterium]
MTSDSNNAGRRGHCSICSQLEDHEFGRQTHGRPEEDTFLPDAARRLENIRELKPGSVRYTWLRQCPECATYYLHRTDYEYLATGSEDEQILTRLTDEQAAEYLAQPLAQDPGAAVRTIRDGEAKVMNRLEVKADNLQFIMVILLGLILLPLGLFNLISGLTKGFAPARSGIGLAVLVLYGAVLWLVRRGHGRSVKYFSDSGLVRNDGRSFAWADLSRVVNQVRFRPQAPTTKVLWRTEIQFKGGESAWLIPAKVSNYREAREYVENLPCEHSEVRV